MTNRLVLFAKPPLPRRAKTRLAADLGPDLAAEVASALLQDTLLLCERVAADSDLAPLRLVLAWSEDAEWFAGRLGPRWQLLRQRGPGLSERLDNALSDFEPTPEDRTVFVGMDAPHLPPERVRAAFGALKHAGAVLGECDDGGYYLLGVLGSWPRGALSAVRWSTAHALRDTRAALQLGATGEEAGRACTVLPAWYDVDDLPSLRRLAADLPALAAGALPHTRAVLASLPPGLLRPPARPGG